jgi:hypothetical protein
MSRSTSHTAQTTFAIAPVGMLTKVRDFLAGMARFEPAATAIYAENARIRSTGRNWLM